MNHLLAKFEYEPEVLVEVYPDEDPDWSWVDDADFKKRINRGDVEQVFIKVIVKDATGHVTGEDSLGGVVIGIDDHKQEIREAIEANDMVAIAKKDLEEKLTAIRGTK